MAIEVGTAIFVNVDVYHHSNGKVAFARPDRGWSLEKRIKKGDIGVVVDIVRDMQPGRWAEHAEVFFQQARKKNPHRPQRTKRYSKLFHYGVRVR